MLRLCVTFFCLLYGVKTGRKSIVLILLFSITLTLLWRSRERTYLPSAL